MHTRELELRTPQCQLLHQLWGKFLRPATFSSFECRAPTRPTAPPCLLASTDFCKAPIDRTIQIHLKGLGRKKHKKNWWPDHPTTCHICPIFTKTHVHDPLPFCHTLPYFTCLVKSTRAQVLAKPLSVKCVEKLSILCNKSCSDLLRSLVTLFYV